MTHRHPLYDAAMEADRLYTVALVRAYGEEAKARRYEHHSDPELTRLHREMVRAAFRFTTSQERGDAVRVAH